MRSVLLLVTLVSIGANVLLARFALRDRRLSPPSPAPPPAAEMPVETRKFPYLSPRIFAENQHDILIRFVELRTQLQAYVRSSPHRLGVYFEYLPSGVSIGVNEKENFILASLLKVPLAMAAHQQMEAKKLSREQLLTIVREDLDDNFGTLWKRGVGGQASVEEAIRLMLTESDNTAKNTLFRALPDGAVEDVFNALDIPRERPETQVVVTPKNYSSVLRSLYLSSYVPQETSNEILRLLTQTIFRDRIVEGVPADIPVAHKIGVFEPRDPKQFSREAVYTDCGIVYAPKRPYILCVMAQAPKADAQRSMREISAKVFAYVSSANR